MGVNAPGSPISNILLLLVYCCRLIRVGGQPESNSTDGSLRREIFCCDVKNKSIADVSYTTYFCRKLMISHISKFAGVYIME